MITVVNKRMGNYPGAVYAGRPGKFGNPFRLEKPTDRAEVLRKFKRWFHSDDPNAVEMRRQALLLHENAVLECWCVPKLCHAQVIADFVNSERKE